MKYQFNIKGLDCANCAAELEEELNDIEGVESANVSFLKQKVSVECSQEILEKVKDIINNFEEVKIVEDIKQYEFKVCGLDCANCAAELEEELNDLTGVDNASVSFVKQKVKVACNQEVLDNVKETINNFEEVKILEEEIKDEKKYDLITIIISGVLILITILLRLIIKHEIANLIISYIGFISAYIIVGYEVIKQACKSILKKNFFDENTLMTIASIAAIMITIFTEEFMLSEAALIMFLYQLGEYLQKIATNSSRNQIKELVNIKTDEANLLVNDREILVIDVEELNIGDIILIKPGEKVPVDVCIVEGNSNFDGKSLTGEAEYQSFEQNDEVLSGYININKPVKAKVIRKYQDSAVKKIIDLVENTNDTKAKPEKFITKFARIYTPTVFFISFAIIMVGIFMTIFGDKNYIVEYLIKGLTVLVISCPCALIISVPLTYFGGLGTSAKQGILVKGATNLDTLANVNMALFDKTGTLTYGSFYIKEIIGKNKDQILQIASTLEYASNHPIASAFSKENLLESSQIEEVIGHGLKGIIDGKIALIGNQKLMNENSIEFMQLNIADTVLYVAYDKVYLGAIIIADKERENIETVFTKLAKLGVKDKVLLTGDNKEKALSFAKNHNFSKVEFELLPEDKFVIAKELSENHNTLYVGDGINDAPVMNVCKTAFSMGKLGSDLAIEVSDVVLVKDDLEGITDAIAIAKKTRRIVLENIIGSIVFKFVMMTLGFLGFVPIWLAVFSDVGIMLLAVLNSLRIRHYKTK